MPASSSPDDGARSGGAAGPRSRKKRGLDNDKLEDCNVNGVTQTEQREHASSASATPKAKKKKTGGIAAALQGFQASFGISPPPVRKAPAPKSNKTGAAAVAVAGAGHLVFFSLRSSTDGSSGPAWPILDVVEAASPSARANAFLPTHASQVVPSTITTAKRNPPKRHSDDDFGITSARKAAREQATTARASTAQPDRGPPSDAAFNTPRRPQRNRQSLPGGPDSAAGPSSRRDSDSASEDVKPSIAITSLSSLKQGFKLPSSGRGSGSGATPLKKPLHSLDATARAASALPTPGKTEETGDEEVKPVRSGPSWAQLPAASTEEQDVADLLSPRKKRRGWVAAGLAERASQLIKRSQTSHTLWVHELSRLLQPTTSGTGSTINASVGRASSPDKDRVKREAPRIHTAETLAHDVHPQLRLRILDVLSSTPASLGRAKDGMGFITGGVGEKVLACACRILDEPGTDADTVDGDAGGRGVELGGGAEEEHSTARKEGLVIFSLTCHARASSGAAPTPLSLARRPPPPPPPPEQERDSHGAAQSQGTLAFPARSRSLAVPANVADLHALLVHDAEVWCWDPYVVVDLPADEALARTEGGLEDSPAKAGRTGLLVSRFAALQ